VASKRACCVENRCGFRLPGLRLPNEFQRKEEDSCQLLTNLSWGGNRLGGRPRARLWKAAPQKRGCARAVYTSTPKKADSALRKVAACGWDQRNRSHHLHFPAVGHNLQDALDRADPRRPREGSSRREVSRNSRGSRYRRRRQSQQGRSKYGAKRAQYRYLCHVEKSRCS